MFLCTPMTACGRVRLVVGWEMCVGDSSAPFAELCGKGWIDSAHEDADVGTFHGFTGEADGRRIDLILIPDRCEATEAEVITVGGEKGIWPVSYTHWTLPMHRAA